MRRLGPAGRAALFAACWLMLVALYVWLDFTLNIGTRAYGFLRCLCEFAMGIVLYELYRSGRFRTVLGRDGFALALGAAIALALHADLPDPLTILLFAALIPAAAMNRGRLCALLERRLPRLLGDISYSIYLVHWPVLVAVALVMAAVLDAPVGHSPSKLLSLALFLPTLALLIGASILTWRWVEVPSRRYLRGRLARRRPAALPASQPA